MSTNQYNTNMNTILVPDKEGGCKDCLFYTEKFPEDSNAKKAFCTHKLANDGEHISLSALDDKKYKEIGCGSYDDEDNFSYFVFNIVGPRKRLTIKNEDDGKAKI